MISRNTLSKYSLATLLAVVAVEPLPVEAANCSGPRVNWGSTSNTFPLSCGSASSRGRSFGAFNTQGGIPIPFRLSAELFKGIHAYAFAYNTFGTPFNGCFPFDDVAGNGAVSVQGLGCTAGVQHNVVVVY